MKLPRPFLQLISVLALGSSALAQTDFQIYTDSLVNGWGNWSFASTVNLNNNAPVHSGAASASVTANPWGAFYLHHDRLDTSAYSDLVFWIHGGPAGGQLLRVQALIDGASQPAVALPALTANAWQQFVIPLASLGVANKPNLTGVWIQDRSGQARPTWYVDDMSLKARPPPAVVNVGVRAAQVIRTVDARHFGINAGVWDSVFDTPTTTNLLTEMGNQTLRFPGGSLSNEYHWQTNTSLNNPSQWATSFDKFAHVASTTQAQVFITVNYGTGTPTEAADWVRYANVTKGLGIKHWEVGNENYGTWETDTNTRPHDPYTYAMRFRDYFYQMKAVDPSIKVGAVITPGETSYANYTDHPATNPRTGQARNGWTPVMLATLRSLGVTPDFVIHHHYPQTPGAESDAGLLQTASSWALDAADLRQQLNDYLGAAAAGVELVCTENNSVHTYPGKQTTSLVNGLFLADSLGALLHTEFNALVWWCLRGSASTGNNNSASLYGWRLYGTYGIVNSATPAAPADRYPTFYVAKMLQAFARGGDQLVDASSDYPWLTAHAAKRADGSLALLVINKSATAALNANISIDGFIPGSNGNVYSYGIPQDEAARTGVGSADIAVTPVTGLSANFGYTFPAWSVTVIALGTAPLPPSAVRQPDNLIKLSTDSASLGDNIYNADGANQTRTATVKASRSATYFIQVQNDGSATDTFNVQGGGSATGFTVNYYAGASGGTDITAAVMGGTYATSLAPGGSQVIRAVIASKSKLALGTTMTCPVTSTSAADNTKRDTVKAVLKIN
jgi:hypothetical protein